ncbi:Cell cycle serine/threonine-protein kinase cdc5/MSD2, partial [Coemansia sp. RSA 520]
GAFGRCYKVQVVGASDLPHWACKTIDKASFKGHKVIERVKYEIRVMRRLPRHENVVAFNHLFEDRERLYMLMELCTSRTLHDLLQKRKRLSEFEARYFLAQLTRGIAALHEARIVHRDIKHSNLLLDHHNRIKIADFGLSTILETDADRKKSFLGTPNFLAPELVERGGHGFGVDVWAAGVLLFVMLYGKPPFSLGRGTGATNLQELYTRIVHQTLDFPADPVTSPSVQKLILKLCCKSEGSRVRARDVCNEAWFLINADSSVPRSMPDSIFERPIRTLQEYKEACGNSACATGLVRKTTLAMRQPLEPIPENGVRAVPAVPVARALRVRDRGDAEKENRMVPSAQLEQMNIGQIKGERPLSAAAHGYALRSRGGAGRSNGTGKASETIKTNGGVMTNGMAKPSDIGKPNGLVKTKSYLKAVDDGTCRQEAEVGRVTKLSEDYIPSVQRWRRRLKQFVAATEQYLRRSSSSLEAELEQGNADTSEDYPRVGMYVLNWLILTKYGVGFRLSDGTTIGALYNDSTSLLKLRTDNVADSFVYVRPFETSSSIGHYSESTIPPQLEKKRHILHAIEKKVVRDFSANIDFGITGDMEPGKVRYPLQMYSTDTAIVFLLMGNVLQFNMNDHSKLFLYQEGHMLYKNGRERWHFDLREGPRMLVCNKTIDIERFLMCLGYAQRALAQWNLSK